MADLERTYTIPLRKQILKVARYQRSKKAVTGVVEFIARHMKQPDENKIRVGQHLNLHIWKHGIKNPPARVKVTATKNDKGVVTVELFGAPKEEPKATETKKDAKGELEKKLAEKITPAPAETKAEEPAAAEKPAEAAPETKEVAAEKPATEAPAEKAAEKPAATATSEEKPAAKKPAAKKKTAKKDE